MFVAALWTLLPGAARRRPAAVVMLAGGFGGPLLAAGGLGLRGWLIAHSGALDQEVAAALHGGYLTLRFVAGVFIGLFLLGVWQSFTSAIEPLPRVLRITAGVIGAWTVVLAASAAFSSSGLLGWLAFAGFVADAVWVAVVGWYLLVGRSRAAYPITLFGIVAIAAGVSGVALVAFPGYTGVFFSWGLAPATVATLVGGCYLAAALTYGFGLRLPLAHAGLLVGILTLSVPVFVVTMRHLDAFDFARWQAWAWVVLFAAFPFAAALGLARALRSSTGAAAPRLCHVAEDPGCRSCGRAAHRRGRIVVRREQLAAGPGWRVRCGTAGMLVVLRGVTGGLGGPSASGGDPAPAARAPGLRRRRPARSGPDLARARTRSGPGLVDRRLPGVATGRAGGHPGRVEGCALRQAQRACPVSAST